ncbi:hypothetical protein AB5I41_12715 [Sphingomonas sp. MMS24-JH45]
MTRAERRAGGGWDVTLSTGETRGYDLLFVCNGHRRNRSPDYPGTFDGPHFHAHDYRTPYDPVDLRGKRVVVVGMAIGNGYRERTVAAARRGEIAGRRAARRVGAAQDGRRPPARQIGDARLDAAQAGQGAGPPRRPQDGRRGWRITAFPPHEPLDDIRPLASS